MIEIQLLADAIGNAAPAAPYVGGVCVISDVVAGFSSDGPGFTGRLVKVTELGGSPEKFTVPAWSQVFDDRITQFGAALVGLRVYVILAERQPFIVDVAVSATIVTTVAGG